MSDKCPWCWDRYVIPSRFGSEWHYACANCRYKWRVKVEPVEVVA